MSTHIRHTACVCVCVSCIASSDIIYTMSTIKSEIKRWKSRGEWGRDGMELKGGLKKVWASIDRTMVVWKISEYNNKDEL